MAINQASASANARHATQSELALNDVLSALKQSPAGSRVAGHGTSFRGGPAGASRVGSTLPAPKLEPLRRLGCWRDDDAARARPRVPALPEKGRQRERPEEAQARREDDARDAGASSSR